MTLKIHSSSPANEFQSTAELALKNFMKQPKSGFVDVCNREGLWAETQSLAVELRKEFDSIVWFGVGGSVLGAQVIADVFDIRNAHFCDTIDPIAIERLARAAELNESSGSKLQRTLFVLASKSGSTIETLVAWDFVQQMIPNITAKQVLVLTEAQENVLGRLAKEKSYRLLMVPADIGGRFSVLGPNGMFFAAFAGLDVQAFRAGARAAIEAKDDICEVTSQVLKSWQRSEFISMLWIYNSALKSFGAWWVQLWAESLAKAKTLTGALAPRVSSPLAAVGPCDQHSMLQQLMDGARDKFVMFVRVDESESYAVKVKKASTEASLIMQNKSLGQLLAAEAAATEEALNQVGVHTLRMTLSKCKEYEVGYFFMFWQMVVATLGQAHDIDAFDQPGVELGKVLAKKKLAALSEGSSL